MNNPTAWLCYLVIVAYNGVDAWQTVMLLGLGAEEINPVVGWFIEAAGTVHAVWWVKLVPLAMLGVGLALYQKRRV